MTQLEIMVEEFQEEQRKRTTKVRSFMDYAMGMLFFILGLYFFLYKFLGVNFLSNQPSSLDFFIGGLFVAYGIWRMYRGYKKNYLR